MSNEKEHRPSELRMIPLDRIEVLNPRERNSRVFEQIVGNIQSIGLKKPIIVTPVLTSTPREKKARSKKVLHETAARDQGILAT